MGCSQQACRFNVVQLAGGEHAAAHDAGDNRSVDHNQHNQHTVLGCSDGAKQHQCQQHGRDRQESVQEPHQGLVQPAAAITAEQPERGPQQDSQQGAQPGEDEHVACAKNHPAEDIPPQVVGPKPVGG